MRKCQEQKIKQLSDRWEVGLWVGSFGPADEHVVFSLDGVQRSFYFRHRSDAEQLAVETVGKNVNKLEANQTRAEDEWSLLSRMLKRTQQQRQVLVDT